MKIGEIYLIIRVTTVNFKLEAVNFRKRCDMHKHYPGNTKDLSEKIRNQSLRFVKFAGDLLRIKTLAQIAVAEFLRKKIIDADFSESEKWLLD